MRHGNGARNCECWYDDTKAEETDDYPSFLVRDLNIPHQEKWQYDKRDICDDIPGDIGQVKCPLIDTLALIVPHSRW